MAGLINRIGFKNVKSEEKNDDAIVNLVDYILNQAIDQRASDIHVETYKDGEVRIRLRIDGLLRPFLLPSIENYKGIITRIKVLSGINIAEQRLPQDGSFHHRYQDKVVDCRVSTMPTLHGEKMVLRILDSSFFLKEVGRLGLTEIQERNIRHLMQKTNGMLLFVGPTGCGKSTSMYSLLQERNDTGVNIMTIEDPVELDVDGLNQIQTNEKINLTFYTGLRSILRQDPDIIMIGEIRDEETAFTAVRAAMTGHLVLSSLHTMDSLSTINRLKDMGVPTYMLAAALNGVVSQRLMRSVCSHCRRVYPSGEWELSALGIALGSTLVEGEGCERCEGLGYYERFGVYEVLVVGDSLRRAIHDGVSSETLAAIAKKTGFRPLSQQVKDAILRGKTTAQEGVKLLNAVYSDAHVLG